MFPDLELLTFSKIIVRPQTDFRNANHPADTFHNHVQYPVACSIGELHYIKVTKVDIFGRELLYKSDPRFRKVLEL